MRAQSLQSFAPARPRLERRVITAGLVLVAVMSAALATQGMVGVVLAAAMSLYIMLLASLGRERTAVLTLMAAFVTAPMYKGLAPSPGSIVTATDVLVAVGVLLLVPSLLAGRLDLPGTFLSGVALVFVFGCVASAVCPAPAKSIATLILWLAVMAGLPVIVALWRPSDRVVDLLCWCYVLGQVISFGYGLVHGASDQGRYGGLATHPNYFAQGALIAFCVLLYLFYRHRYWVTRLVAVGAGAVCAASIYLSGSRAAMLVAAVLVLMVPVVERSAIMGFVYAIAGALCLISLPLLVDISGESSSLGRLVGGNSSNLSDQARDLGRKTGLERFFDQPFTGTGLVDLFDIHNMYLEISAGIGVFGLLGLLLVLFTFTRPLFSDAPHRRLLYAGWAFISFGATVPGFYDRSIWLPVALGMVAVMEYHSTTPWFLRGSSPDVTPSTAAIPTAPTVALTRKAPG